MPACTTYHVIVRLQGDLEDVSLLCLNQEEEHVLWREGAGSERLDMNTHVYLGAGIQTEFLQTVQVVRLL